MRIITGLIFIVNIILWVVGITFAFSLGTGAGFLGIICFIIFLISWKISGDMVTAPADYFFQPEWNVFITKLKWSNSIAAIPLALIIVFSYV